MSGSTCVVLGGGISGLAAAERLSREGVRVTVLEAADDLGGLGRSFAHDEVALERFYHCVMPHDDHLLPLLERLGIEVRWERTTMGMIVGGRRMPFNTARDLLRFTPLTLAQRIRFGLVSVSLRHLGRGRDLDRLRVEDWLRRLYGDAIWDRLFRPMFGSKFGPEFGDVPALYLWSRLGRESNVSVRGYPVGGYRTIVAALRRTIEARGGVVHTGAPVRSVVDTADGVRVTLAPRAPGVPDEVEADRAVSTVPLPLLRRLADDDLASRLPRSELRYQGVVNAAVILRRPLDGHYWSAVLDADVEFDGVIEMSALTGTAVHGGRHVAYVMHYADCSSPLFAEDPADIARRWRAQFLDLFCDVLTEDDVEAVHVFRAPFVEPVYPLGYRDRKPAAAVPGSRLVLATTAQIYPGVTSWNASTGLAQSVVRDLLPRLAADRADGGTRSIADAGPGRQV